MFQSQSELDHSVTKVRLQKRTREKMTLDVWCRLMSRTICLVPFVHLFASAFLKTGKRSKINKYWYLLMFCYVVEPNRKISLACVNQSPYKHTLNIKGLDGDF